MPEMTRRERIMAASRKQRADKMPFFHFWRHSQIGWAERECRNRGMGMSWARPCAVETMHGVKVVEESSVSGAKPVRRRTYKTPVGSVYTEDIREPGVGQWHGQRSWRDISPWTTSRMIKGPKDYRVVKWMVEHTEYAADYFPIEQALDWLGDEGVVVSHLPHSPMQTLMIDWVGSDAGRFFFDLADHADLVEDLYEAICRNREPLHQIAAKCPAEIILCGDNLDGFLVNPRLFEKYFMPVYAQQAQVMHAHDKLMAVHMDGRIGNLRELIARTEIDIVEALHPPPMGDLSVADALSAWPDKAIWIGFPGGIYELGPEATRDYTLDLLRETCPGDRLVFEASTENLVSNENLLSLTSVLANAELPLDGEAVDRIARSLV